MQSLFKTNIVTLQVHFVSLYPRRPRESYSVVEERENRDCWGKLRKEHETKSDELLGTESYQASKIHTCKTLSSRLLICCELVT